MTPRDFLDLHAPTAPPPERTPLRVRAGETVGVVLVGTGGPSSPREAQPYLYRLLMDAARVRLPFLPAAARDGLARLIARRRAARLAAQLRAVGGASPECRLVREQAAEVERALNRGLGAAHGVTFRAHVALRYGEPGAAEALAALRDERADHVVVVPLAPAWLDAVSGGCLAWWRAQSAEAGLGALPTAVVIDLDGDGAFAAALRDRVSEALQRFPREARADAHVLVAVHPAARFEGATPAETPLAALATHALEGCAHPHRFAFGRTWGLALQAAPGVEDELQRLARAGVRSVLVVPVGYVCETMDTAYELDVVMRERAERLGLLHYEVAGALNCSPAFLRALNDAVRDVLDLPASGDRLPAEARPARAA